MNPATTNPSPTIFPYDEALEPWENYWVAISTTRDIDPTYEGLYRAAPDLGEKRLKRVLLSMLMFYNSGFACQCAEVKDFWRFVEDNYERAPRGTERRHFRGDNGRKTIQQLKERFPTPEDALDALYAPDYLRMREKWKTVNAFGDYFVWKVFDYYDRILGMPVNFDSVLPFIPQEPIKGAQVLSSQLEIPYSMERVMEVLDEAAGRLSLTPPGVQSRRASVPEAETFLCMYQHSVHKRDYVGKDILSHHQALAGKGELAEVVKGHMPPLLPANYFPMDRVWLSPDPAENSLDSFME